MDANASHLELARCFSGTRPSLKREVVEIRAGRSWAALVVVPLAYSGTGACSTPHQPLASCSSTTGSGRRTHGRRRVLAPLEAAESRLRHEVVGAFDPCDVRGPPSWSPSSSWPRPSDWPIEICPRPSGCRRSFFGDDVTVGCLFWLGLSMARYGPRHVDVVLGRLTCMGTLNVPVVRALSSPLTTHMIGAAGGPLFDSIAHYVTWSNIVAIGFVIIAAAVLPSWWERVRPALRSGVVLATVAFVAPGPVVASRIDVRGLQRNALTTVASTVVSDMIPARPGDWR